MHHRSYEFKQCNDYIVFLKQNLLTYYREEYITLIIIYFI
jgi:hypothetical protein